MTTKTKRQQQTHSAAPFGAPDGATGDLENVETHFVKLARSLDPSGLASAPEDRMVRIFVGKKGVGKTTYLRRFQASANSEPSVFAADREAAPPSTDDVVRVSGLLNSGTLVETWQAIWRRAIQRSVVTRLLYERQVKGDLSEEVAQRVREDFKHLLPAGRTPRPVYAEATEILKTAHTRHRLAEFLTDSAWTDLEYWLGEAAREVRPIYIYLDAVDDHFQRAPMYWLQCQKGLFYEAMSLQGSELGSRVHVVISIRDLVLSSVLRTENASRYRGSPYIRLLEWDYRTIRYFLAEKLRRLDGQFRMRPKEPGIEGWLGRATMMNRARGVEERVEDYLLRHTRLIPRDIVELGNALCAEVVRARADGLDTMPEDDLRRVVGSVARGFADEQIRVCANQIASDDIPQHGGRDGSADFYIGTREYADARAQQLTRLLCELPGDRFDQQTCRELGRRGKEELGYDHLLDVLWHNGVLGYDSTEAAYDHADFYAAGDADLFHLPLDKPSYVLHPSVPHLVHIEHRGDVPVRGYRKG